MSRAPRFALTLGISLVAVLIAVAITTWAASPITGSDSAGPTQARDVILVASDPFFNGRRSLLWWTAARAGRQASRH